MGISNVSRGIFEGLYTAGNLESVIESQLMETFVTFSYPSTQYSSRLVPNQGDNSTDRTIRSASIGQFIYLFELVIL